MIRFIRGFLFALSSIVEVSFGSESVAALPRQVEVFQEPQGCMLESQTCFLKSSAGRKYELKLEAASVTLAGATEILRTSAEKISLISGELYIDVSGNFTVEVPSGIIALQPGRFWLERTRGPQREGPFTRIRVLQGQADLRPLGSQAPVSVPEGYQNWIGVVNKGAVAQTGIPLPIDARKTIHFWARVFPGSKTEFRKEVRSLTELWRDAVESAGRLHQNLATRTIASYQHRAAQLAEIQRKQRLERERIRQIYFEKTFE